MLAYAGPRPAEALKVAWRDVRERTLVIEPAKSKTRRVRTVRLLGGEFRAHFFASGWEGTGHVDVCEPPRRLRVLTKQHDETEASPIEVTLTPDGDQTILV